MRAEKIVLLLPVRDKNTGVSTLENSAAVPEPVLSPTLRKA